MCIVVFKPKGVLLPQNFSSVVKQCMRGNSDGAGIAIKKDNSRKIIISKGYWYHNIMMEEIAKYNVDINDEFLFHARIGTSGKKDNMNCHPFYISNNISEITAINGTREIPVLAHNGVFSDYSYRNSLYSDTVFFIKEFLIKRNYNELLLNAPEYLEEMFTDLWGWNKFVVLYPNRDAYIFNKKSFILKDGIYYSNHGGYVTDDISNKESSYLNNKCNTTDTRKLLTPRKNAEDGADLNYNNIIKKKKAYGTFELANDKLTVNIGRIHMMCGNLNEKAIVVEKKNGKINFKFADNHFLYSVKADKDENERKFVKIVPRPSEIFLSKNEASKTYNLLKFYRTGLLIESVDKQIKKWISPIELYYNYNVAYSKL
jgi:predicted glutamine amidotransferase